MRQKSIGEVLRTARESRGWNFVDLQRITKIQAKYLQALEYNDFEAIPDPEYTRHFLKTYADILELDADVLLDAYQTNSLVMYYEEGEEQALAFELKRSYKVRKRHNGSYLPLFYLLLVAGLIIIFITYMVHRYIKNQPTDHSSPSYSVVSQAPSSEGGASSSTSEVATVPSSQSQSRTIEISGGGEAIQAKFSEISGPIQVKLSVKEVTSWISLSETELAGGVLLTPENPTVTTIIPEGTKESLLVLGVVDGVEIMVANHQIDTSALTSNTGTVNLIFE